MIRATKKSDGFTDEYWICKECGEKKGWKLDGDGGITCISGKCSYCKSGDETTMIPTCDFTKPGQRIKVWD